MTVIIPGNEERGYNPNQPREPNGRFASCDTGGGFGGEDLSTAKGKSVDKSVESGIIDDEQFEKNQKELQKAIEEGEISTKLDKSKQRKHKLNSNEYNDAIKKGDFPGYTELSNMEIQTLINENSDKGKVYAQNGQYKKVISTGDKVVMYGDLVTRTYIPSTRATIHYSKSGTHLVPAKPI